MSGSLCKLSATSGVATDNLTGTPGCRLKRTDRNRPHRHDDTGPDEDVLGAAAFEPFYDLDLHLLRRRQPRPPGTRHSGQATTSGRTDSSVLYTRT